MVDTDKPPSLIAKVINFLNSLDYAESIDALLSGTAVTSKRADFLVEGRSGIVEVKSIESKLVSKMRNEIAELRMLPDAPKRQDLGLQDFIDSFADPDAVGARIFDRLTKGFRASVRGADKQIKNTKEVFNLPNAWGILLICNEHVHDLPPLIVMEAANRMLYEATPRVSRYPNIHATFYIFRSHFAFVRGIGPIFPFFGVEHKTAESSNCMEFFDKLRRYWVKFDLGPDAVAGDLRVLEGDKARRSANAYSIRSTELGSRHFYLRELSDDALTNLMGRKVREVRDGKAEDGRVLTRDELRGAREDLQEIFSAMDRRVIQKMLRRR